jgi:transposase
MVDHRTALAEQAARREANDRKVLNGIYWRLRSGSPWADIPERYGPSTTCYNRFVR